MPSLLIQAAVRESRTIPQSAHQISASQLQSSYILKTDPAASIQPPITTTDCYCTKEKKHIMHSLNTQSSRGMHKTSGSLPVRPHIPPR